MPSHPQQSDDDFQGAESCIRTPDLHQARDSNDRSLFPGFEGLTEEQFNIIPDDAASFEEAVPNAAGSQPAEGFLGQFPQAFDAANVNIEEDPMKWLDNTFGVPAGTATNTINPIAGTNGGASRREAQFLNQDSPLLPNALMQVPSSNPLGFGNASYPEYPKVITTSTSGFQRPQMAAKMPTITTNPVAAQPDAANSEFWNCRGTVWYPQEDRSYSDSLGHLNQIFPELRPQIMARFAEWNHQVQHQHQHPSQTQGYAQMTPFRYGSSGYDTGNPAFQQGKFQQHEAAVSPFRHTRTPIAPAPSSGGRLQILSDQPVAAFANSKARLVAVPLKKGVHFTCFQCPLEAPRNGRNDGKHCTRCFNKINAQIDADIGKPYQSIAVPTSIEYGPTSQDAYTGPDAGGAIPFTTAQQSSNNPNGPPFSANGGNYMHPSFDLEHQSVEAALEYIERPSANDCEKLQIEDDDWESFTDINGEFKLLCQQLFSALSKEGTPAPSHSSLEQQHVYHENHMNAHALVSQGMKTQEQIREVKARVIKAMHEVVRVHQIGVPKAVLQNNRGYDIDMDSKCSERAQKIISHTRSNKFIALNILRSRNLAQLARSPDTELRKKYGYYGANTGRGPEQRDRRAFQNGEMNALDALSGTMGQTDGQRLSTGASPGASTTPHVAINQSSPFSAQGVLGWNSSYMEPSYDQSMSMVPSLAPNATPHAFMGHSNSFNDTSISAPVVKATPQGFMSQSSPLSATTVTFGFPTQQPYTMQCPTDESIYAPAGTVSQGSVVGGVKRGRSDETEDLGDNSRYEKSVRRESQKYGDWLDLYRATDGAEEDADRSARYEKRSMGDANEIMAARGVYGKRLRGDPEKDGDGDGRYGKRASVD